MLNRFRKRPWGFWLVLLDRKHFKVKLLRFKKGGKLSEQYHEHRNELWIFLSGEGHFQGDRDWHLSQPWGGYGVESDEWRLASAKTIHWYEAYKPTWVLEIQYGEKCVEEDIVRV